MDTVPVEYLMFFRIAFPSGLLTYTKHGKWREESKKQEMLTQKSMSRWPPPPT